MALFFSNCNIDTADEFARRLAAARRLGEADGVPVVVDAYDHADWLEQVARGFEREPEKGARCARCFRYSLARTAAYAAAHGMTGFCANQPQFSLARQEVMTDPTLYQMDREMYEFHVETGMPCVPFSSQAKGFFIKLHDGAEISDGAKRRFDSPGNRAIYARLLALSEETGYSVGALSLAYLTCNRFDIFPIVGVSRLSQVEFLREAGDARISLEQAVSLREV